MSILTGRGTNHLTIKHIKITNMSKIGKEPDGFPITVTMEFWNNTKDWGWNDTERSTYIDLRFLERRNGRLPKKELLPMLLGLDEKEFDLIWKVIKSAFKQNSQGVWVSEEDTGELNPTVVGKMISQILKEMLDSGRYHPEAIAYAREKMQWRDFRKWAGKKVMLADAIGMLAKKKIIEYENLNKFKPRKSGKFVVKADHEQMARETLKPFGLKYEDWMEPLERWLIYKKEINQKYTHSGYVQVIKKLVKLSNKNPRKAMLIIEQSITRGWKGLFDLQSSELRKFQEQERDYVRKHGYTPGQTPELDKMFDETMSQHLTKNVKKIK